MKTKNLPLIIGIALPVLFIIIISIVIFAPSYFINPTHNFVYILENDRYGYNPGYLNTYDVEGDHVALIPTPLQQNNPKLGDAPKLYMYDVKTDTSHEISFEEAKKLTLDPGPSSPDGYSVGYLYNHDGIFELFGSNGNNSGFFITKGNGKKKITSLSGDRYYSYQGNFKLIGWVK